jgi:hypothetical protein
MSLDKCICKLNLRGHILVLYSRLNIEAIYSNMFSELVVHGVLSNTDSINIVTVHMRRGGESNTKSTQGPP